MGIPTYLKVEQRGLFTETILGIMFSKKLLLETVTMKAAQQTRVSYL